MYRIRPHTISRARELGVVVVPSFREGKKIDVLTRDGHYITSVGALGYDDFPSYIEEHGIEYAMQRRHLYMLRHNRDMKKVGSKGWWAFQLLWN
jgi:hypothetical protein